MHVQKDTVVSIFFKLTTADGRALEDNIGAEAMAYLHGHGNVFSALEEALVGLQAGDQKQVTLTPDQAYGRRREDAVHKVPIKHLMSKHKRLIAGQKVKVNTDQGAVDATVVKVGKFMVDVDLNHPYAGLDLCFDVRIENVREASPDEIAHGHAHGVGGHHH